MAMSPSYRLECAPFPKVIRFEAVVTRKVDSLECAPFPKVIRYVPQKKPL